MSAIPYNLTNLTGNFVEQAAELNKLSEGIFIAGVMFAVWVVLFISAKNEGMKVALLGVSFIMTILCSMLWYLGWLSAWIVMIPVVATIFGIFMIRLYD